MLSLLMAGAGMGGLVVSARAALSSRADLISRRVRMHQAKQRIDQRAELSQHYESHGFHLVQSKLHMTDYRCDSGTPPYTPVTDGMVVETEVTVVDATGRLVGWVAPNLTFDISDSCYRENRQPLPPERGRGISENFDE